MSSTTLLLQTLLQVMAQDSPAGYFLNKQFDISKWADRLLKDIENKRSSVTALTRTQASALGPTNLQFSAVKHESRINAFYRLIGLPTELSIGNEINLLDSSGNALKTTDNLSKALLQREYEQLQITFKQFLTANSVQQLNTQLNSAQATDQQLIAELFDPNHINTDRLFPMVQYSQIQSVIELKNRIAPSFASTEERYVGETLMQPPFLESIITIRLLPQSGGAEFNTQGAVETITLQALGYALAELAKQYQRNQTTAEHALLDGIAFIRGKVNSVASPMTKQADSVNANTREPDQITTQGDIRSADIIAQNNLYSAAVSLLPLDNDIIPTGPSINNTPLQARSIKDNALTSSFIEILNANVDAMNRVVIDNKNIIQKRQLVQDKLTAELGSTIGEIGGISMAEIIILISALFVMDEDDLVGLIPDARYNQLIGASNNNTSASSSGVANSGQANMAQKQINIFDILNEFKDTRTSTTNAVTILQNIVGAIYVAFVKQLKNANILPNS